MKPLPLILATATALSAGCGQSDAGAPAAADSLAPAVTDPVAGPSGPAPVDAPPGPMVQPADGSNGGAPSSVVPAQTTGATGNAGNGPGAASPPPGDNSNGAAGGGTGGGGSGPTASGGAPTDPVPRPAEPGGDPGGQGPSAGGATRGGASGSPADGPTAGGAADPGSSGAGSGGAGPMVPTEGPPVARHGQLRVVGNRVHGEHGAPVTLRGQGFGWDNWWPQFYNADVVGWLRSDWCVDVVRPAMGIEPDGAYLQNPAASRDRIRAVVDAAIAEQMYVIIDWHAHDRHQNEAIAFFTEMAQAYGDQPNVLYEVYNEPEEETWPEVKAYAEAVLAAIRQHDPDNLVIVGSPEWDQRIDLVAEDPITSDANVVYSVHFYAATHGEWLRDRTAAALADGIPVIVSESSGSEAAGTGANDYAEWEAWIDFMDQNQISWLNYSVSDKEGETISVLEPGASATGGWDAGQLTETGEYIRDVFRSYCE